MVKKTKKCVKKTEKKTDWLKRWSEPIVIDGETISEKEWAEFLDWSFVNDSKDFQYFRFLKKEGKYKEVTKQDLMNRVK